MQIDFTNNGNQTTTERSKRVMVIVGCGGYGTQVTQKLKARMSDHPAVAYRFIDTAVPAGVPSTAFTELRPDRLADDPGPALLALIRAHGMTLGRYRIWKSQTGKAGMARIPCLASLAGLARVEEIAAAIEGDLRARAAAVGGVAETMVVTCTSLVGGTGASSARVAGLASRLIEGLAPDQRWVHVCVTSRLLPPGVCTRRARALEHRQLIELQALVRATVKLHLPHLQIAVSQPGPDLLVLLDSSAECPRSFDEAVDELAATLWNLVTL
jgi:hypothetical protein